MKHILRCKKCSSYTLKKECPNCSGECINPRPPKFSLDDKYAGLRRKAKKPNLEKKGLI